MVEALLWLESEAPGEPEIPATIYYDSTYAFSALTSSNAPEANEELVYQARSTLARVKEPISPLLIDHCWRCGRVWEKMPLATCEQCCYPPAHSLLTSLWGSFSSQRLRRISGSASGDLRAQAGGQQSLNSPWKCSKCKARIPLNNLQARRESALGNKTCSKRGATFQTSDARAHHEAVCRGTLEANLTCSHCSALSTLSVVVLSTKRPVAAEPFS